MSLDLPAQSSIALQHSPTAYVVHKPVWGLFLLGHLASTASIMVLKLILRHRIEGNVILLG